jgi:hypothetical protein
VRVRRELGRQHRNGFYGGLQFTEQTWLGYGGGRYAASANQATPAEQIAVAQRVLAGQGIGAWPVRGARVIPSPRGVTCLYQVPASGGRQVAPSR